jgi:hypothetical protein
MAHSDERSGLFFLPKILRNRRGWHPFAQRHRAEHIEKASVPFEKQKTQGALNENTDRAARCSSRHGAITVVAGANVSATRNDRCG